MRLCATTGVFRLDTRHALNVVFTPMLQSRFQRKVRKLWVFRAEAEMRNRHFCRFREERPTMLCGCRSRESHGESGRIHARHSCDENVGEDVERNNCVAVKIRARPLELE